MSKQRPSKPAPGELTIPNSLPPAGFNAAYWRRRVFKNTFYRDGRRTAVKGWSVKIQHQGWRRTFSLAASNREAAAREAWQIHQALVSSGREEVPRRRGDTNPETSVPLKTRVEAAKNAAYWKRRLLHRRYVEMLHPNATKEFSVRIEHAGRSHYFLLGTMDEDEAAAKAVKIHQMVTTQEWDAANEHFRRELTVAFHWSSNPLAWTYTTIHTHQSGAESGLADASVERKADLHVAIIEPEAQIAQALAKCVSHHRGFCCAAIYPGVVDALEELASGRTQLVLINHNLPGTTGIASLKKLETIAPCSTGVLYSIHEDSEQLFTSTPGGAAGYLLKRVPPHRILDPIAGTLGKGVRSSRQISIGVRGYFQSVFAALPTGDALGEMAKLTPRELEILTLLSKGYVDKLIAVTLHISIWTVHGHVKNIFEKLGVHTRTEAVVKFLQK